MGSKMKDEVPPALIDAHMKSVEQARKEGKTIDSAFGLEKSGIAGTSAEKDEENKEGEDKEGEEKKEEDMETDEKKDSKEGIKEEKKDEEGKKDEGGKDSEKKTMDDLEPKERQLEEECN